MDETSGEDLAALQAELAALRARVRELEVRAAGPTVALDEASGELGRRQLLKRVAAGAVGAVAGASVLDGATRPAAAAEGSSVTLGGDNQTFTSPMDLRYTAATVASNRSLFLVHDTDVDDPATSTRSVIAGIATGPAVNGIHGKGTLGGRFEGTAGGLDAVGTGAAGVGSYGVSAIATASDAVGGYFSGGRASIWLDPSASPPIPGNGVGHEIGEIRADATGRLWYCRAAGAPGTWERLSRGTAAPADGDRVVLGDATHTATARTQVTLTGAADVVVTKTPIAPTNAPALAVGTATALGTALYAENTSGSGGAAVIAIGGGSGGIGVLGRGGGTGATGVTGSAFVTGGVGGAFGGTRSNLALGPGGAVPASRSDAHAVGDVICDTNGDLWFCTAASPTPGTFRKVSGPATAGAFHALPAPIRVCDTRTSGGPITTGTDRIQSVANQQGGGNPPSGVPAGATAIVVSFTIVDTVASGFLALASGAITAPNIQHSNANWTTNGQILATSAVTAIDANRQVRVKCGGGGSTNYLIDVVGYYQ